jgi:hypothetical protein
MFFLLRLLIHMVAILIIAYLLPNVIRVDGLLAALVAAFLLGIVNAVIRPSSDMSESRIVISLWPRLRMFLSPRVTRNTSSPTAGIPSSGLILVSLC